MFLFLSLLLLIFCYYIHFNCGKPIIVANSNSILANHVKLLPSIHRFYFSNPFLFNGHLQTIYNAFYKVPVTVNYSRTLLTLEDGGVISIDKVINNVIDPKCILVILHGVSGGSHEKYW